MVRKATNLAPLSLPLSLPLPGIAAKRGRPATGKALSSAERQQRFRKKHNVVQFRPVRIVLAQPVTCWDDVRRAA